MIAQKKIKKKNYISKVHYANAIRNSKYAMLCDRLDTTSTIGTIS